MASTLNAVDDTRVFEKMAASLAAMSNTSITIIGQPSKRIPVHANIQFITLPQTQRLSLKRVFLPILIALKVLKVKPQLLIVNTHELLIVSSLIRILFGIKIIYDIRENYYRNIRYSEAFIAPLRLAIAASVRLKERLTSPLISHFTLAEKVYKEELTFISRRYTVIENKAALPKHLIRTPDPNLIQLLFSGTISRSTGVFEAIRWASMLHQHDDRIQLNIIGFCALNEVRKELQRVVSGKSFIKLIGISELVPHTEIVDAIKNSHFGIIYYPKSLHTHRSMPTKLYEYMAAGLPILTKEDQYFAADVDKLNAGLIWNEDAQSLLASMKSKSFYPKPIPGVHWEGERLSTLVESLVP